ncbi:NAD(P)-binding protein [Hypoxylon rubiginosum]|uniref:NAD(P)-binding protein n=1 Tax=Hypoxylon rubiginosum TaxID=110542 RepID=A0ACB9YM62_9PEZI|nr:NAD(P)-binding protein [Hypoxylon rubiginosum]
MPEVDNEIRGRLALITGASGGIGAACARALWAQGASLALTYFRNVEPMDKLTKELVSGDEDVNQKFTIHCVDTGSAEAIEQLFLEIKEQHSQDGPNILVSNAGYGKRRNGILDVSLEEFDYTINVNLRASFILSKLSIPHMEAQGWGRIIFISSIAAQGGGINACHYAASKAGLTGLMKNLAMKHAKAGITVNDVAPAMIGETGMIPDEKFVEGTPGDVKNIPVGRLGTPEECANVVSMICKTGYLTGQSILLSGGLK